MHPRLQTRRARSAVLPTAAVAFAALDSFALIGLSGLLAAFGLWR